MLTHEIGAGFAQPVDDAQTAFRAILDALANPGTIRTLPLPGDTNPAMPAGLTSVVLTLTDHDTPIWLSPTLSANQPISDFMVFHTGAPIVSETARASFAFIATGDDLPLLDGFNLGTAEYPDRSTTLVLALPSFRDGAPLVLRGPGIQDTVTIDPTGLPEDFVTQWMENRQRFPRGVDLLLVAENAVIGLPRTARIGEA